MSTPTIRPARPDEYDEIARIWMNSWASTGLEEPSHFLLAKLRARVALEVEKGWTLYVADDGGALAAVFRAVADGRNRKALRARADRHFRRRAEDARISCDQSDGQGACAEGR